MPDLTVPESWPTVGVPKLSTTVGKSLLLVIQNLIDEHSISVLIK